MVKFKLKKDDPIIVTVGKDKGKKSKIVRIVKDKGKVIAEGVNVVKRHMKPSQINPDGGIVEKEMPIDISNVMYFCSKCSKGVRLGIKVLQDGSKQRFCKSCGEIVDKD